jgi:hypothetical protein
VSANANETPVIFISYSHDSDDHGERIRGLAASLWRDGCQCRLDVHKDSGEDWPAWMTRQLIESDFVLCVVSEVFNRRFRDQELPDVGQGVGWEAGLIRRLLYAKKLHNDRIFPVFFDRRDREHIPLELQGYDNFLLDSAAGYEALLRKVLRRPQHALPPPGAPPDLPTRSTTPLFARPGSAAGSDTASLSESLAEATAHVLGKYHQSVQQEWNDRWSGVMGDEGSA